MLEFAEKTVSQKTLPFVAVIALARGPDSKVTLRFPAVVERLSWVATKT